MYIKVMTISATDFRKSLFALLERVLRGESVEISYKGATVRLVRTQGSSKLSRAKRQHALLCHPDSIVGSDESLLREMDAEWRKDWQEL